MNLADLNRTLADSDDRESWLNVHDKVIGASTAAKFARPGSVETYVRQLLEPRTFSGNATTANGNTVEPYLLAWAGAKRNTLFVHAIDNKRFAATPDGVLQDQRGMRLVETKAKHNKIVAGPEPKEIRQMAWQLMCVPEADGSNFVWGEYVNPTGVWELRRDPKTIPFDRDHPQIVKALELIVPIAHQVIDALDRARSLSQKVPF